MKSQTRTLAAATLLACTLLPAARAQTVRSGRPGTARKVKPANAASQNPKSRIPSAISILVRATSEVPGRTFTLGEIAEITGGDKVRRNALAQVEIGTSPLPGLSRPVFAGDVTVHLRASRLDGKDLELVAPPTIRVTRSGHDVTGDEITRVALEAGRQAIKTIPNATVEAEPIGDKLTVGIGKLRVIAGAYSGSLDAPTIRIPVSLFVEGKLSSTLDVILRIRRKSAVLVARRTLQPHEIVTAADIMLAPTDLPAGFTRPMTALEDAIGKRTTRRILADSPLSEPMLETPPALSIGDRITLEWIFGGIYITAPGLAQQAGAIGDIVRVYATDTHRELQAVILDSHTVRIADSAPAEAEIAASTPSEP